MLINRYATLKKCKKMCKLPFDRAVRKWFADMLQCRKTEICTGYSLFA